MARTRLTRKKVNDPIVDNALRDIYDKIDGLMPETDGKPSKRPPRAGDTQVVTTDDGIVTDIIYDGKQWLVNVNGNFHPAVNSNGYNTGEGTKGWSKKPITGESVKYDSNAAVPIVNKKGQNIDIINNDGNLAIDSNIVIGKGDSAGKITSKGDQDLILDTGSTNTGSITITDGDNGNIAINAHGTGKINVDGDVDLSSGSKFKINGTDLAAGDVSGLGALAVLDTIDHTKISDFDSEVDGKVTAGVNNLIDSAPGALDTLNELAAALGDDANFSTTVTTNLGYKPNFYKQDAIPNGASATPPVKKGDLWMDTNDSNKIYIAEADDSDAITAGEWVLNIGTKVPASAVFTDTQLDKTGVENLGIQVVGSITSGTWGGDAIANDKIVDLPKGKITNFDAEVNALAQTKIDALIDGAPSDLNTLNAIAAALGDNASFAADITNNINSRATKADPVFTGTVQIPNISNLETTVTAKLDKSGTIANGDFAQFDSSGDLVGRDADQTKSDLTLNLVDNKSAATLQSEILTAATANDVGLGNVTNESKATMFDGPAFTGTLSIDTSIELKNNSDDFEIVFDNDNKRVISSQANKFIRDVNDGNPVWQIGSSDTECLQIVANYNAGAKGIDVVEFISKTASSTGDKGAFTFSVDEATKMRIDDAGLDVTGIINATSNISTIATGKVFFDNGNDTYIHEVSADKLDVVVGGQTILEVTEGGGGASDSVAIQALNKLYFDGVGDTYITESAADTLDFVVGGDTVIQIDENGVSGNIVGIDGCIAFKHGSDNIYQPVYGDVVYTANTGNNTDIDFRECQKARLELTGGQTVAILGFIFPEFSGNFTVALEQDSSGSGVITAYKAMSHNGLSTTDVKFPGGSNPTLTTTANKTDIISIFWDAESKIAYAAATLNF